MAMASTTLSVPAAAIVGPARSSWRRIEVKYINGLNSFGGLKAHNSVATLGLPVCTEQSFAKIVSSMKKQTSSTGKGGGALSSTCNAEAEIFRIAAIIPGLVLVRVAVGFALLRIEATIEEAE
ncbi:Cytochrome b6-f complex subunit 7 [Olea europaea subsp. europaea]|uniref:Cytochrome b6-f complex subunit 7 n=1 Tax=Olea europaea subsp. europaea TaxID=158383 RepID=A0A8S0TY98_OLEEU|nr:Cytochrome b6-f complex subunit 7 [Olea europaea subsp. europaea]